MTRIGEALVARGFAAEAQIRRALDFQRSARCSLRLGSILLGFGTVSERGLLKVLMDRHRVPGVSWSSLSAATPDAIAMLPADEALRLNAVPYAAYQQTIGVALTDPTDAVVAELGGLTGRRVVAAVAPEIRILQAHARFYGRRLDGTLLSSNSRGRVAASSSPPPETPDGAYEDLLETGHDGRVQDSSSAQWLSEFAAEALDEFEMRSAVLLGQPAAGQDAGAIRKAGLTTVLRDLLRR